MKRTLIAVLVMAVCAGVYAQQRGRTVNVDGHELTIGNQIARGVMPLVDVVPTAVHRAKTVNDNDVEIVSGYFLSRFPNNKVVVVVTVYLHRHVNNDSVPIVHREREFIFTRPDPHEQYSWSFVMPPLSSTNSGTRNWRFSYDVSYKRLPVLE